MPPTASCPTHPLPDQPGIAAIAALYEVTSDPAEVMDALLGRIERAGEDAAWISRFSRAEVQWILRGATARRARGEALPLYGIPFAVKDNIDVAGLPTTAGCPDFAYRPDRSAAVVERLVAAGAIPIAKTNLDQFATGLNGTRSPYGIPVSVCDRARVSGGSSSGSAVVVAAGLVPFALGTDTAGSGRVPAAFNNIVGLKPTRGLLSTTGVVPACRSLDCVSVFAGTVGDALTVARIAAGFDTEDPYSRAAPETALRPTDPGPGFRFGIPGSDALDACEPQERALFAAAAERLRALGGEPADFDFAPFAETAELLYAGPWVAERLAALRDFAASCADRMHPVVREVILGGARHSAADAFAAQHRLAALVRRAEAAWARMDVLLLPTAPLHPTVAAMLDDPVGLNARLGSYTNFVNLMDLAALAVPAGFGAAGQPFGVTLVGRAFADGMLALLGDRLHRGLSAATVGGTGAALPRAGTLVAPAADPAQVEIAVVGAHLTGQPLNAQLTARGGVLARATRTAPGYSLYALAGTVPLKPGLVRDGGAGGIEVEIWRLPVAGFGAFVAEIPPPLGIGTIALAEGGSVKGFLCEPHALAGARDITAHGGWRGYLRAVAPSASPEPSGAATPPGASSPEEVSP